jgi:ATP-binding cassette subfamily B protein
MHERMNKPGKRRRKPHIIKSLLKTIALVKTLWPLLKQHKARLLAGMCLSAAVVGLRVAGPWPLKWIIDILSGERPGLITGAFGSPINAIMALSAGYVLLAGCAALCEYLQALVMAGLGNRIVFRFRSDLFHHIMNLPLSFHDRRETGELITRVVYDTARLRQGVRGILLRIFQNLFLFCTVFVVMLHVHVLMALVLGGSGILILLLLGRDTHRIQRASLRSRKHEGKLASTVTESLLGIREMQTFQPGQIDNKRFSKQNAKSLKEEQKVRRLAAGLLLRVEVILAVAVAVVLYFGALAVRAGHLTAGDLILFISYVKVLNKPYRQFARQSARMGRTLACADRLQKIMAKKPMVLNNADAVEAPAFLGNVVFDKVSLKNSKKLGGKRRWILKDVSFKLDAGERLAIVGHNGAGKSTLLRLVLRLVDPDRGAVKLDGVDIRSFALQSLRKQMSVVFQDSIFFGLSVGDNIAMGRPDAGPEEIKLAASKAQASRTIENLKDGYKTIVRKRGNLFSGGERQRIALARAILSRGRIWLLDEPTANLDRDAADELVKIILEETRGKTTIWVTHDQRIIPLLDRVMVLENGEARFFGTPQEFAAWRAQNGNPEQGSFMLKMPGAGNARS